jgi:hypothetical protein
MNCLPALAGIIIRANKFLYNEPINEDNKDEIEIGKHLFQALTIRVNNIITQFIAKLENKSS